MPYTKNAEINIYYEVEGIGQPLVLCHGIMGSLENWRETGYIDGLRDDCQLILIDSRGHGKSDKPHDPPAYRVECLIGDVIAVLDDLGIERTSIFGYSYGGRIALDLVKHHPGRIVSVIVGGMTPRGAEPDDPGSLGFIQLWEAGPEAVVAWFEQMGPLSPERRERLLTVDYDAQIAIARNSWPNRLAGLPNMTMPFLIIIGEADEMQQYDEIVKDYQNLPDVTFLVLPGLNHGQTFQNSSLVIPRIKKFLTRAKYIGSQ